ncbi:glycosyltransferase family 2 protein [Streptococcus cristatus]|jgi:putative glycosyltransferase|uniref:glycosyltransferase family 2 protein n=1 Tax=Streptococcus cristatus TaxID=45634 RepID=UPI0011F2402B|nr:glycosyltransferase family 2 protein [Streptococcus cristatus]
MEREFKAGFVILNYNTWEDTARLARKVATFEHIQYVIIVDNLSSDDSYRQLKILEGDKVSVYQTQRNGGYSFGNNVGAKIAYDMGVDILFISNPDVDIDEKDSFIIAQNLYKNSSYALLSGIEYNINKEIDLPIIWHENSYYDDLFDCLFFTRKLREKLKKVEQLSFSTDIVDVELLKGSFFAIRMSDFHEVDFFDDTVFLFCEERILAKKLKRIEKKIGILPTAKYYHNHSTSINVKYKKKKEQMNLLYQSRYYYNVKYNNIGLVKKLCLKLFMFLSSIEYSILDYIKQ